MGHGSSKEKVTSPMGQQGKPIGMARKGAIEMEAQRVGLAGASTKTMSRPTKGIKGGGASPRAHAFLTVGDKHEHEAE